jgi:hypothetical protein
VACTCRQSRGARAAAAAIAAWSYMLDGPPDAPVYDAAAEADAAVAQLLDADVVITTYDVLQQVRLVPCCPCLCGRVVRHQGGGRALRGGEDALGGGEALGGGVRGEGEAWG